MELRQNSAMQERIKFLQDLQQNNPDTANWFDAPLNHLLNELSNNETK